MLDYTAYVMGQRSVRELARSAMPDAPVVPFVEASPPRRPLRRRAALTLHRIADRLQPA